MAGVADLFVKKPFVLAVLGTSLTAGRLSGNLWWQRFYEQLRCAPEAVGPVVMRNFGQGSQTSVYGVATAPDIAAYNPTHILSEGFAINDSAFGISRPDHLANMQTMHDIWKTRNPAVDITWQTMNGVSTAGMPLRPDLPLYYDDEITKAAAMGDRMLDNYYGAQSPPGVVGGWPKPLPEYMTDNNDGLHPIWDGALEIYLWPNVYFWARLRMAEYWGLAPPDPPPPPPVPDAEFLVAAGGGGGGAYVGAGGGAGGRRRAGANVTNLLGPVLVGFGGAPGVGSGPDSKGYAGFPSVLGIGGGGPVWAYGGGFGAGYAIAAGAGPGGPGGSGGGSYGPSPSAPGAGTPGQGNDGGLGLNPNSMSGGGGGAAGVGGTGASGGAGGPGVLADWPGAPGGLYICGGGPGVAYPKPPQAYPNGGGPTNYGGGGRAGDEASSGSYTSHAGGPGRVVVWYPGAARAVGGTVTTFGGFTIHTFDVADQSVSMTADNAPAGNVSSVSSAFDGNYPAWKAFSYSTPEGNGGAGKAWASGNGSSLPAWLKRRWTGAPKRWLGYALKGWNFAQQNADLSSYIPKDWKIQGSNDDVNWTDLDVRAGETAWASDEVRVYKMNTAVGSFEYYRMLVTAANGQTRCYLTTLVYLPGLEPI